MPTDDTKNGRPPGGPSRLQSAAIWLAVCGLVVGLMAWYLALSHRLAGEFGFPLDDSWIHMRFAQNLAAGHGFSFNPGELTSTTTGALWTILLALAYRITGEHLFTAAVLNGALCVLLCVLVYQLTLALAPRRWLAAAAAMTTAVTVPLPWWALSGMEPPLYGVLALLGILLHLRLRRSSMPRALLPTVVFALAGLARPECFLLFPRALIDRIIIARWVEREERSVARWARDLAIHVPIFALMVAPLFVYNYRVTGYALPSSYYSKLQWMGISGALATERISLFSALVVGPAREVGELLLTWAGNNLVLILPFFVGLVWQIRRAISANAGGTRSLLIPMVLLVQPVAWAVVAGYRPPDFQSQRYLANVGPLFLMLGVIGGWRITEWLPRLRHGRVRAVLLLAVLAASLARQPGHATTYARNVRDTTQMHVTIGRWVRDNVPPGSLLAVNDVGAIAVISDCRVLDLQGLVTTEILSRRDMAHRLAGTAPQAVFEFIAAHRPDYLIIFPAWYPDLAQRRDLFTPVFWVALDDNITAGSAVMIVYRTVWAESVNEDGGGRDETWEAPT